MKKFLSLFLCISLLFSCLTFTVNAEEAANTTTSIEYFEDGSYVVTELEVSNPNARTAKTGKKTQTWYDTDNIKVFTVTLTGTFDYTSGVSASATGQSISVTRYVSDAVFHSKSATHSGATVYGSGTIAYFGYAKALSLQITCDKYGNLT